MTVYGFEKLGERNDWSFYHINFHRDSPDNLVHIMRVKSNEKPAAEALERKKYYQTMLSESGPMNEKDDSTGTAVNSIVSVESNEETTLKLLQSPQFILNSLSSHLLPLGPLPSPLTYNLTSQNSAKGPLPSPSMHDLPSFRNNTMKNPALPSLGYDLSLFRNGLLPPSLTQSLPSLGYASLPTSHPICCTCACPVINYYPNYYPNYYYYAPMMGYGKESR